MVVKGLVSIVVPVYKAEKYLDACISSILNQTYSNIELILVEDHSPDNSLKICYKYAAADNRVKLIEHKTNTGYCIGRNDGINASSGDWVMLLDSDDEFLPVTVETMVGKACELQVEILISTYYDIRLDGKKRVAQTGVQDGVYSRKEFAKLCLNRVSWSILSYPCTKIYSKKFLDDNNIRLSEYHDGTFLVDAISKSKTIGFINNPLVLYYQRVGSISRSYRPGMYDFINEVDNRLKVFLEDNGAMDKDKYIIFEKKRTGLVIGSLLNVARYRGYSEYKEVFSQLRERDEVKEQYKVKWKMSDCKKCSVLFFLEYNMPHLLYIELKIAERKIKVR